MVLRTFGAFDNEAFTVVSSPSAGLVPGSGIINNSNTPIGTVFEYSDGFPVQVITLDDLDGPPNDNFFNDDDEEDHIIVDGSGLVANGTEVESESYHFVRQLDAFGNPFGPTIQITVFSQNGQTSNIWGMSTDTPLIDGSQYIKVGGSNNGTSEYEDFVCFTAGAMLATATGERRIEDLQLGDQLITRDNGLQEVRWIGSRTLSSTDMGARQHLRPVTIKAGALGNGMPARDTVYSPNHRVLLRDPEIALVSGQTEMFAAAKDLVGRAGIARARTHAVTYVHVMFDRHEAVLSDGMWTESFLPGPMAMGNLADRQRREVIELFPELENRAGQLAYEPARPLAKRAEVAAARMIA